MKLKQLSVCIGISFLSIASAMKAEIGNQDRNYINWDPGLYEKSFDLFQSFMAEELIKEHEILDKLECKDVLDIGCGNGMLTALFGYKAQSAHGIDINPSMIEEAKKILEECEQKSPEEDLCEVIDIEGLTTSVTFDCCALENFTVSEQYDFATAFFVLQWIPYAEQKQAVKNIFNALRPGGSFFGTCNPEKNNLEPVIQLLTQKFPQLKEVFSDKDYKQLLGSYHLTQEQIKELFEEAGFVDIVISEKVFNHDVTHEDLEAMYRPGVIGCPFMEKLNEKEREDVLSFYLSLIESKLPKDEDDVYTHKTEQFIIQAQKPV